MDMASKKDNLPLTVDTDTEQTSSITYASEVVAIIAGVAAGEVEGIAGMCNISGEEASVDLYVIIEYGTPIQKAAQDAQENVRKSIESMTGLHVVRVDVHVQGVSFEKENSALSAGAEKAVLEAGAPAAPEKEPAPVGEKADEAPEQIADEPAPAPEAEPAQDGPEA